MQVQRANGDIVPGAVEADGEGGLRVYEITGGSHRSDFSYRLLGEAEYKEIWKKPSRRRFCHGKAEGTAEALDPADGTDMCGGRMK